MTLSNEWTKELLMSKGWEYPDSSVMKTFQDQSSLTINDEAIGGWCPVDCNTQFKIFGGVMFLLMILGSTGRIGKLTQCGSSRILLSRFSEHSVEISCFFYHSEST